MLTQDHGQADFILVGDLHLRTRGPLDGAAFDESAFVALVRTLEHERPLPRFVLLGDTFDLPSVSGRPEVTISTAIEKLDALAAAHPRFFSALGSWTEQQGKIDVLAGNHDIALSIPEVEARLRALLGADGTKSCRLRVHPWLLHIPGVLHAEHGQQLHDINAFPALLSLSTGWNPGRSTVGEHLDDLRGALSARSRRTRRIALSLCGAARVLETAVAMTALHASRKRAAYRASALPGAALETGLSEEALVDIDRLSEAISRRVLWRLGSKSIGYVRAMSTSGRRDGRDDYMLRAWPRLAEILERHEALTPVIALGHTHAPRHVCSRRGRQMINPGTWLRERGAHGGAFGRISVGADNRVRASLHWWDGCSAHPLPTARKE